MKILHTVEFYSPSVGGAQEVIRQVSEQLVRRGHDVTVATTRLSTRKNPSINGVRVEEFDISGNQVRGFKGDTSRYQQFLMDSNFDVMLNYAAQQWATDLVFPVLSNLNYSKILVPCGFSALWHSRYADYFRAMPDVMRKYDHLIFHSHTVRDIRFALDHGLSDYSVISNGASKTEFDAVHSGFRERYGIPSDVPLLLTVGSHTGLKGHGLAIESFRRAKIGRAVLVVIGNTIGGFGCLSKCRIQSKWTQIVSGGQKTVMLLDPPREDVLRAYAAADLFVFGSSVECSPLVLFEAMAAGTPFVTVACGNAAEIVEWSRAGQVIPTKQNDNGTVTASPTTLASAIEELLRDRMKLNEMSEAGKRSWKESFTWDGIALQYESLYKRLVETHPRQPSLSL